MGFIVKEKQMRCVSKDVDKLKKQLDYFLFEKDEPIIISLQGYWGIGKTYFWNNYIKDKEQDNKHVYISLFGINSLDDIKRKIVLKIYNRVKISTKLKEIVGSSKIFGIDLSSVISILNREDFKDIIICFDDFERMSPNLSISEVLGFISELKEQHSCKIVLINNNEILKEQDKLYHKKIKKYQEKQNDEKDILLDLDEKELFDSILNEDVKKKKEKNNNKTKYVITSTNNYEIFEQFSEKIVDIKLKYEPSIDDVVNIVKSNKKGYIDFDFIVKFFNSLKNQNKKFNLRLIKQLMLKLEVIEDFLKCKKIEDRFKRGLIFNIARLVVKENIRKFDIGLSFNEIDSNFSEYKDQLFDLIYRHRFDVEKIKNIFIKKSESIRKYNEIENFKKELEQIYLQYCYDMQYSDEKVIKELKNKLKKNDIVHWLGLKTFYEYVEFLKKIDNKNEDEYDRLIEEKVKEYIRNHIDTIDKMNTLLKDAQLNIINKNDELKNYFEEIKDKKQEEKISSLTKEEIINLIDEIYKNRGWEENQEKLFKDIPYDKHKEWLINDKEYFRKVFDFLNWLRSFSGNIPFKEFYDKTVQIYKELYREEKYKNKIGFVLERLNLIKD